MMRLQLMVSLILWVWVPDLCHAQTEQFAGPFRIVMQKVERCDKSGTNQIFLSSSRISKVSRTKYVYTTNVTLEVVVNDDVTLEFDIASWGNGGWRPHFMQLEVVHYCSKMKIYMPDLYKAVTDSIGSECPVSPGTYELKDLDIETAKVSALLPNFPYGQYRSDSSLSLNGTLIGCMRGYFDVVPKRRTPSRKKSKTKLTLN